MYGERIRKLRKERGLRQSDVAEALHIARSNYAKIESGDRDLISGYCIQIADYFGVTCDYLLRGIQAENVSICQRTGLSQKTVDSLADYEAEASPVANCRKHIINAILQDKTLLNELAKTAMMKPALGDEETITETQAMKRFVANASFDRFYSDLLDSLPDFHDQEGEDRLYGNDFAQRICAAPWEESEYRFAESRTRYVRYCKEDRARLVDR